MKFIPQKLPGVFLIEPEPFVDDRGMLRRHFCQKEFAAQGIPFDLRQANISENTARHTLRGFHLQRSPFGEGKVLSCPKGAIHDVVLDLRSDSPTRFQWMSVELSDTNRKSLYFPPGCANAWLTLEANTWILYYHSESYAPGAEGGIRFDDPFFKFAWPAPPVVISDKDRQYPLFDPARA